MFCLKFFLVLTFALCLLPFFSCAATVEEAFVDVIVHTAHQVNLASGDTSVDGSTLFGPMSARELIYSVNVTLDPGVMYSVFTYRLLVSTCHVNTNFDTVVTILNGQPGDTPSTVDLTTPAKVTSNDDDYTCSELPMTTQASLALVDIIVDSSTYTGELFYVVVEGYDNYDGQFTLALTDCGSGCSEFAEATPSCSCAACADGFTLNAETQLCELLEACPDHASDAPTCTCDEGFLGNLAWSGSAWLGECVADCTAAPDCTSLLRDDCLLTPETCGPCLPGFFGVDGDANDVCSSCFDPLCTGCTDANEGSCISCEGSAVAVLGKCNEKCPEIILMASDGDDQDDFGRSVSISGDILLIGAYPSYAYGEDYFGGFSGSAYLFALDNGGQWMEIAKLTASDGSAGDEFGNSVSISGDISLIGAYKDDDLGYDSGSAYVFALGNDGQWTEIAKLTASDGAYENYFGISVSISGDILLIGSYGDRDFGRFTGSAYLFALDNDDQWTEITKLIASVRGGEYNFGISVSISGDTLLIGSPIVTSNSGGSAFVFALDNGGQWKELSRLTASDGFIYNYFGYSVSISGDTLLIGCHLDDDLGSASGSAYLFALDNGGNWTEIAKLTASDGAEFDYFGCSVSISGDFLLIGSRLDDDLGSASGSAYLFALDNDGNWTEIAKHTASDGAAGDYFGRSVAVNENGHNVIVGTSNAGKAYIFSTDCGSPYFINCPDDVGLEIPYGSTTTTFELLVEDKIDPTPTIVCDPPLTSAFNPASVTSVICSVTDESMNEGFPCAFDVTVLDASGVKQPACLPGTLRRGKNDSSMGYLLGSGDEIVFFDALHVTNVSYSYSDINVTIELQDPGGTLSEECDLVSIDGSDFSDLGTGTVSCTMPALAQQLLPVQYRIHITNSTTLNVISDWSTDLYYFPVRPVIVSVLGCDSDSGITGCDTSGGDEVTVEISGSSLVDLSVLIDGKPCVPLTYLTDDSSVVCTVPAGIGIEKLITVSQGGITSEETFVLSYAAPRVESVSGCTDVVPSTFECSIYTPTLLTLHGSSFGPSGATVFIGTQLMSNVSHIFNEEHNDTQHTLEFEVPPNVGLDLPILVIQENGRPASASDAFVSYEPCPFRAQRSVDETRCECEVQYYDDDNTNLVRCELCPDEYMCTTVGLNISTLVLRQGWWRSDVSSIEASQCYGDSCQEGGVCTNYREGPLCALCKDGYVASSLSAPCDECLESGLQIFFFFLAAFAAVFFCVWYVRRTMSKAQKKKSDTSTLIKITLSAFQINAIAGAFSFEWERAFQDFTAAEDTASSLGTSSLSFACLLNTNDDGALAPVYIESLLYLLSAVFLVALPAMVMVPWYRCKHQEAWSDMLAHITEVFKVAIPILAFLLHPTLCQRTLALYHCTEIDSKLYLTEQLDELCWQGDHLTWFFIAAIPMTFVYVLGIPLFGYCLLVRNKDKICADHPEHDEFHRKFSFLYKGYAVDNDDKFHYAYLWELVVTARKILLMMILVFYAQNAHVQSLLGLAVVIIGLFVHSLALPFESKTLNIAEFLSLLCSVMTFFLGQFTYADTQYVDDDAKIAISWVAVLINVAFLITMAVLTFQAWKEDRAAKKMVKRLRNQSNDPSDSVTSVGDVQLAAR